LFSVSVYKVRHWIPDEFDPTLCLVVVRTRNNRPGKYRTTDLISLTQLKVVKSPCVLKNSNNLPQNAGRNSCGLLYHSQDCNATLEGRLFCQNDFSGVDFAVIFTSAIGTALTIRLHFVFVKETVNSYKDSYINMSL
jgi:hypothetical protein